MGELQLINDIIILLGRDWPVILTVLVIVFVAIYISSKLPEIIFRMYEENAVPEIQHVITELIYQLDEFADDMSNEEKRNKVIDKIQELLKFNNATIPRSICGLIVDMQVRRIRQLQESCSADTDLHK